MKTKEEYIVLIDEMMANCQELAILDFVLRYLVRFMHKGAGSIRTAS